MSTDPAAPVRWGIAGPGAVAATVVGDLAHVPGAELAAVGSRSLERAAAFAREHGTGATRAHGSYGALLADPGVDVVHVATPHPQHHALALAAIAAGKAVLIEKAFTATAAGAEEVVAAARAAGVFAMEGMWTRFQPAIVRARELVAAGAIGELRAVQAELGTTFSFDPADRLFAPELGGGALLDLGVYVVSFAQMVLGTPDGVVAHGAQERNGVDARAAMLLTYPEGRSATLQIDFHSPMPGHARIFGSTGWIDVLPRFHHPRSLVLHREGHEPERIDTEVLGRGYAHQVAEVHACLAAGRTESEVMPLDDTLAVMRVLDDVAAQLGVRHAEDPTVDI